MASLGLGRFNAFGVGYGDYNVYFQYDDVTRSGTSITIWNARVYYERIGTGYSTNRIATTGNISGQYAWNNVTLNNSGTASPASMTHNLGNITINGVDYLTSSIGVNVQAKGTGASTSWSNTSGTVQLNNTFSVGCPVINISTVTATDSNIESASTININRYNGGFTHNIFYKFDGQSDWTLIATGVATSYGWTIPSSVYALIPNSTSIGCTILCQTYNGASYIGENTARLTAYVNTTTNAPTVSAVITDNNTVSSALTGDINKLIKYISNAKTIITATAKNSSTISSYKVTCGDGKFSSLQTSILNAIESGNFTVQATDSRGITTTVSYTKTIINYIKLSLNPTFYRTQATNNTIALTYNGNYFNSSFGSQNNTLTLKYRYKQNGTTTWGSYIDLTPTIAGNTYNNGSSAIILGTSFDYTKAYDFEIVANDKIYTTTEVTSNFTVSQGIPPIWWNKSKVQVEKDLYYKGKIFLDNVYPVGSLYMNTASTNPNILFGGTWVRLVSRYLYAMSGTAMSQSTEIGTTTVATAITEAQMPSHNHTGTTDIGGWHEHQVALNGDDGFKVYYRLAWGGNQTGYCITGANINGQSTYPAFPSIAKGNGNHTHSFTTGSKGSGSGHSHNIPFVAVAVWYRSA